jgi:hypothetical protein
MSIVIFESDAGLRDLNDYRRGVVDSQNHFREAAEATDLAAIGMDFAVPFFVFQGALDNMTRCSRFKSMSTALLHRKRS